MEFSEESVYLIGAILGLAISTAVALPVGKANLNWALRKSLDKLNKKEIILNASIVFILMMIVYYVGRIFYYYTSVIWVVVVGAIV